MKKMVALFIGLLSLISQAEAQKATSFFENPFAADQKKMVLSPLLPEIGQPIAPVPALAKPKETVSLAVVPDTIESWANRLKKLFDATNNRELFLTEQQIRNSLMEWQNARLFADSNDLKKVQEKLKSQEQKSKTLESKNEELERKLASCDNGKGPSDAAVSSTESGDAMPADVKEVTRRFPDLIQDLQKEGESTQDTVRRILTSGKELPLLENLKNRTIIELGQEAYDKMSENSELAFKDINPKARFFKLISGIEIDPETGKVTASVKEGEELSPEESLAQTQLKLAQLTQENEKLKEDCSGAAKKEKDTDEASKDADTDQKPQPLPRDDANRAIADLQGQLERAKRDNDALKVRLEERMTLGQDAGDRIEQLEAELRQKDEEYRKTLTQRVQEYLGLSSGDSQKIGRLEQKIIQLERDLSTKERALSREQEERKRCSLDFDKYRKKIDGDRLSRSRETDASTQKSKQLLAQKEQEIERLKVALAQSKSEDESSCKQLKIQLARLKLYATSYPKWGLLFGTISNSEANRKNYYEPINGNYPWSETIKKDATDRMQRIVFGYYNTNDEGSKTGELQKEVNPFFINQDDYELLHNAGYLPEMQTPTKS